MPLPVELPLAKHFGPERIKEIEKYAEDRLRDLKISLSDLRERKISAWRRIYSGMPRESTRSFPWQGASNLVVQLVGSYVDQLKAKFLMSIFGMDPLWDLDIVGKWDRKEHAAEQKAALQEWMIYTALEPSYLNLLPKYSAWASSIIRYGSGAMKIVPERDVEVVWNGSGGFSDYVRHDGPTAHPLIFEDFLKPLTVAEVRRSPFTAQRTRCSRFDLEKMRRDPSFSKAAISDLLTNPDRQGPDQPTQELQMDQGGMQGGGGTAANDEWDIYECWFPWQAGGKKFQLILTCHLEPFKTLKAVFNWLPENSIPYVEGVLGWDGERSYGYGFCEMLKDYQEEVSAIHNRRGDASTLANTNIFRIGSGTQLDTQFSVYPNAVFPGEAGAFESIPLGRQANETIKDEQMTLQLATDRAGIGPSSSGAGAGSINKKGAYSAMGTYAIMQEGDTRANMNKTEFKQAHVLVGRQKVLYDAWFGIPQREIEKFGESGKYLQMALENVKKGRIALPIRAATGSINKEVEKQNEMLLLNNYRAHWSQQMQLLQAMQNPMMSPQQRDYLWQTFEAANWLMAKISRDFGIADPSAALPSVAGSEAESRMAHDEAMQTTLQKVMQHVQQPGQAQLPAPGQSAAQPPAQPQAPAQPPQQQGPVQ